MTIQNMSIQEAVDFLQRNDEATMRVMDMILNKIEKLEKEVKALRTWV